jgi:hypothetical protein
MATAQADEGAGAKQRPDQDDPQDLLQLGVFHLGDRHVAHAPPGVVDQYVRHDQLGDAVEEFGDRRGCPSGRARERQC